MTTSTVNIEVRTKGQQALDRLANSFKKVEKSAKTLERSVGVNLTRSLTKVGRSARELSGNLNKVAGGLRGLAGAVAGLGIGNELRKAADEAARFSAVQKRLELVTQSYTQFIGIQEAATASARKFGLSGIAAAEGYASLAQRLGASGASLSDISDTFDGFNTVLALNGTTAQEAASAQLQLAQALGAGKLQGEEFRAVAEATPQVLDAVAKQLNVSRGELKDLASEGKITSKVLVDSLRSIKQDGADDLAEALKTPAGQIRIFQSAITDLQVAIGQQLLPVIVPFLQVLTKLAQKFGQLPGPVKAVAVSLAAVAAAALLALPAVAGLVSIIAALAAPAAAAAAVVVLKFAAIAAAVAGVIAAVVALTKVFPGLGSAIQRAFSQVLTFLGGFVNGFINGTEGIKTQWGRLTRNITNVWQTTTKFLSDAWNAVVDFVTGLWQKASDFLQQNFGFIYTAFAKVANALVEAWNFAMAKLPELTKVAVANIINILGPITGLLKAAGFDLGAAVADGIEFGFAALEKIPEQIQNQTGGGTGSNFQSQLGLQSPAGGGGGGSKGASEAEKAAQKAKEQLAAAQELVRVSENQLKVDQASNELNRLKLEYISQKSDIEQKYSELLDKSLSAEETLNLQLARKNELQSASLDFESKAKELKDSALSGIKEEIAALEAKIAGKEKEYEIEKKIQELTANGAVTRGEAEDLVGRLDGLKKEAAQVEKLDALYAQVGNTIADGIVAGITDAIEGGENLQKILSDTLKSVGKLLINAGVRSIGGGIGIPGFADGGIAPAGMPSLVGERGPELITPLTPVAVSPFTENGASLADQVGNAAGADAVDAFDAAAQSLGTQSATMNSNAAQAQADSMMQSEGKMTIETQVINSVEYATVDQVRKASSAAAKTARARVFSDLKNKPTARGGIGL